MGLFFFLAASGCDSEKINEEIQISDAKLVAILADLHMIESAAALVPNNQRDSIQVEARERCAEIHDLTMTELTDLIASLERDIPKHRSIYKQVSDTIQFWINHADSLSLVDKQIGQDSSKPIEYDPIPK